MIIFRNIQIILRSNHQLVLPTTSTAPASSIGTTLSRPSDPQPILVRSVVWNQVWSSRLRRGDNFTRVSNIYLEILRGMNHFFVG